MKRLLLAMAFSLGSVLSSHGRSVVDPFPREVSRIPVEVYTCLYREYTKQAYDLLWSHGRVYAIDTYLAYLVARGDCTRELLMLSEDTVAVCLTYNTRCGMIEIGDGRFGILFPPTPVGISNK